MNPNPLNDILDPEAQSFESVVAWINDKIKAIRQTDFTPDIQSTFTPVEFKASLSRPMGPETDPSWRRFFLSALISDWACYDNEIDRADFSRMKYVIASAYRTTRVWFCKLPDGLYAPVGYTCWYPIPKFVFDGSIENPQDIDDRGIFMPSRFKEPKDIRYAYVFDISIIPQLLNTQCSKKLALSMKREDMPGLGAISIAVGAQGHKFLQMAGFTSAGDITVQGEKETLYVLHPK